MGKGVMNGVCLGMGSYGILKFGNILFGLYASHSRLMCMTSGVGHLQRAHDPFFAKRACALRDMSGCVQKIICRCPEIARDPSFYHRCTREV